MRPTGPGRFSSAARPPTGRACGGAWPKAEARSFKSRLAARRSLPASPWRPARPRTPRSSFLSVVAARGSGVGQLGSRVGDPESRKSMVMWGCRGSLGRREGKTGSEGSKCGGWSRSQKVKQRGLRFPGPGTPHDPGVAAGLDLRLPDADFDPSRCPCSVEESRASVVSESAGLGD